MAFREQISFDDPCGLVKRAQLVPALFCSYGAGFHLCFAQYNRPLCVLELGKKNIETWHLNVLFPGLSVINSTKCSYDETRSR